MNRSVTLCIAFALFACTDFSMPSELHHPQILAIKADPPVLAGGDRTRLSILVAGPDGEISPIEVVWTVTSPVPQLPVLGEIQHDSDGTVWYAAPEVPPGEIAAGVIDVTVRLADGTARRALKGIAVGAPIQLANPEIVEIHVGGESLTEDGAAAVLPRANTVPLDITVAPAAGEDAIISWFATLGEIELYRRAPTEILTPEEAGHGWLFVVYRDGQQGVVWRRAELTVE